MKNTNIAKVRLGKFYHDVGEGAWLPWPVGSRAANRFWQERRYKRNKRKGRSGE